MKYLITFLLFLTFQSISFDISLSSDTLFVFRGEFKNGGVMGIPMDIAFLSDGSFVLREYDVSELKKFDQNGNLVKIISNRGRGPGEFIDINYVGVNSKDEVIVLDRTLLKLVKFSEGAKPEEYFIFKNRPSFRFIHSLNDSSYLIGGRDHIFGFSDEHIYYKADQNFKISKGGFVNPAEFSDEGPNSIPSFVMRGSRRLSDNSILTESDDLVVAPMLYSGKLIVYKKSENYEIPNYVTTGSYGPSYKEYSSNKALNYEVVEREGINIVSTSSGRRSFYHYNRSLGLFRLKTGEIIHFVQIKDGKDAVLRIEILNLEANTLLENLEVERIGDIVISENTSEGSKHSWINLVFHNLDNQNKLFVSRFNNGIPELHVIQFNLDIR